MSFVRLPILRHGLMVRHPEILPDTVVAERVDRVRQWMVNQNVEALLIYGDPLRGGPVCYVTNYPCFGLGRRAMVVLGLTEGPFLFTAEPSRNLPRVRLFTTCDLEKTRQFLSAACDRALKLSEGRPIGLVGMANLPVGLVKDAKQLISVSSKDLSREFSLLLAIKDETSQKATRRACELAQTGMRFLSEQAVAGKDLWNLAAYVDYRLRLLGCEDTNILLGSSSSGLVRPGYPDRTRLFPGSTLVAYIAVQYARHWGIVGKTLSIEPNHDKLHKKLAELGRVQKIIAPEIRAGMNLGKIESTISSIAGQAGFTLTKDLSIATGVGFDLHEYPISAEDRAEKNMVLQVVLAVDFKEGFTGMLVGMLQITNNGGVWLTGV